MSTVSPDGGSLRAFVILFLLSFRWTRKIEMLYSFNFVFGPQMGSTTVRFGGGVTGAARSTHATELRAATCVSRNENASILIIWNPSWAWTEGQTTRLTNESIKLHFKQHMKTTDISFKFNPRCFHGEYLSYTLIQSQKIPHRPQCFRYQCTCIGWEAVLQGINGKLFQANNANLMWHPTDDKSPEPKSQWKLHR